MPRRDRRNLQPSDWSALDEHALAPPARQAFEQRRSAIEAYVRGDSLEHIEITCGVHRSTVVRLVRRAQCAHPDGRLWGYRALVPQVRVQPYERIRAARVLQGKAGNAGAFGQLLQRYPSLMAQLRAEIEDGQVTLRASGELGRLGGVKAAAQRFHQGCRDLGLGAGDYPLNQQDKAVRCWRARSGPG